MLCGMHVINALLQGPIFDEVSLGQIAQQLDNEERMLLGRQDSFYNQPSHNVAADGNFSIQVLTKAMEQFAEMSVTPLASRENQGS